MTWRVKVSEWSNFSSKVKVKKQTGNDECSEDGEADQPGDIMRFDCAELHARLGELGSRFEDMDSDVRELHNVDQGELTKIT